jgi:hypothetical protein
MSLLGRGTIRPFNPDLLFVLIQKVSKKIKACLEAAGRRADGFADLSNFAAGDP